MSGNNLTNKKFYIPKHFICGEIKGNDYAALAYEDNKGTIKCESSWKTEIGYTNWAPITIKDTFKTTMYENIPISGFKLLRDRHTSGRGFLFHDNNLCIVEDPRGFYFCITLQNLLWILETEGIERASGILTGEYCMSWVINQGTENIKHAILIPTSSPVYKETIDVSNRMTTKINIKDLVPGNIYYIKGLNKNLPYIGAFKTAINLGEKYRTVHLFQYIENDYSSSYNAIEGRKQLVSISIQNILYDTGEKIIPSIVKELSCLFEKTAYSYSFWKNKASNIFEIIDLSTIEDNKLPKAGNYFRWIFSRFNWGVNYSIDKYKNNKVGDLIDKELVVLRPIQCFDVGQTKETQCFAELLKLTPKTTEAGYNVEFLDKLGNYKHIYYNPKTNNFKSIYPKTKLTSSPNEYVDKGKRIIPGILTIDLEIDDSLYVMAMMDLEFFMDTSKLKSYFLPWKP